MLYNVFLPTLQFSPVSIIPPLLHTHSFIYHPLCIMFFSQHFSFPLSVSFHHCSILIHSSTTHTIIFFSQYFTFPCQYHSTIAPHSSIQPHAIPTCRRMTRLLRTSQAAVLFQNSRRTVLKSTFIWSLKVNCTQESLSVCLRQSELSVTMHYNNQFS
jgi:hypothetical protein